MAAHEGRIGTAMLSAGGLALIGLMAYTLWFDPDVGSRGPGPGAPGVAEVAVLFPDRADWLDFRRGVDACVRRGLARRIGAADGSVTLETPRSGRQVRFSWRGVTGVVGTRDEARALAERPDPPIAVVGSINTVLTAALADQLQTTPGRDPARTPLLLIPWATAVLVDRPGPGSGPSALLDLYPGRAFRFCPNNQREADLVVDALTRHEGEATPCRVILVVDRRDPYSVDLAACFRRAIGRVAPRAEIVERPVALDPTGPVDVPGPGERTLAASIWESASGPDKAGRPTWVALPLQGQPTRRMLAALRERAPGLAGGQGMLRVICGDGAGVETIRAEAGNRAFPVWSVLSASAPVGVRSGPDEAVDGVQVSAEIVAAILVALDEAATGRFIAATLRKALLKLDKPAGVPSTFGRGLAFDPKTGERRGVDLGHVLASRPDRPVVESYSRGADGRWAGPTPVPPPVASARP